MKSVPRVTQLDGVGLGRAVRGPDPAAGLPAMPHLHPPSLGPVFREVGGGRPWWEGGEKGGGGESASGAVSALSPDTPPPSGSPHPLSPPPPHPTLSP